MDNGVVKLTLEELQERWAMLQFEMGIEKLIIKESLKKYGDRSFMVDGLEMEFIEDYVVCSDYGDEIINSNCFLMMFLRHHLTNIFLIPTNNSRTGYIEKLEFGELGTVFIEKSS